MGRAVSFVVPCRMPINYMSDPWIGIGLVFATFGALLAIFSIIGPLLQPEVLRKGLHISMGLTTLSLPVALRHARGRS